MDTVQRLIYQSHSKSNSNEHVSIPSPPPQVSPPPTVRKVSLFSEIEVQDLPSWSKFELDDFKKELWWKPEDYERMLLGSVQELRAFAKLRNVTDSEARHMLYQPEPESKLVAHSTPLPR